MSALGLFNFIVLQWFGVRLARMTERRQRWVKIDRKQAEHLFGRGSALVPLGDMNMLMLDGSAVHVRWFLLRWVWPLTGWWSDYRWIARRS